MPAKGSLESVGSGRAMHERANAEIADSSDFGKFQREGKTLSEFFLPVSDCFLKLRDILQESHALFTGPDNSYENHADFKTH